MSSLLSTPESPFVITNKDKTYSFIDKINPSGGNTSKTESTGVITRFTINNNNEAMKDFVKINNLTVADIIMLIVDSYYNDLKIDTSTVLKYDEINKEIIGLNHLWSDKTTVVQSFLTEDDVMDVCDYVTDIVGNNAISITHSDFKKVIPLIIQYVSCDNWTKIFCLLWNKNPELNRLFTLLINEFKKLHFETEVYVPFDAVLRDKGTLLKIEWLDSVCGIQHGNYSQSNSGTVKGWHLKALNIKQAWSISKGSPNVVIAIVDDGFDVNHKMLKGRFFKAYNIFTQNRTLGIGQGHVLIWQVS